jgi:tetratricopeptide (TPR) repeat protein
VPVRLPGSIAVAALLALGGTGCGNDPDQPTDESSGPGHRRQGADVGSARHDPTEAIAARFEGRSFEDIRNEAFRMQEAREEPVLVLEALRAAHALDPAAYGVNRRLGQVYGDMKLNTEALEHFRAARAAKPEALEDGLSVVRLLLALDRREEALQELEPLLIDEGTRGEALFHQARILDFLGDRDGALAAVRSADTLEPTVAYHAISLHGRFLMEQGEITSAEALFRKALSGRADYKEALRGMADSCRRQGRAEEADRWDRILRLFLDLTDNVFVRKRPVERRRTLEEIVAQYPEWTLGFQQLALQLRREGDNEGACRVIGEFLDTHSDLVGPTEAAALRDRFCSGVPR